MRATSSRQLANHLVNIAVLLVVLAAVASAQMPSLIISPASAYVRNGQPQQFTPSCSGGQTPTQLTWSATVGQITQTGLYTGAGQTATITVMGECGLNSPLRGYAYVFKNGGKSSYTNARTDQTVLQVPSLPNWGGLYGVGNTWTNSNFGNNIVVTRITDGHTDGSGGSLTASGDSGDSNGNVTTASSGDANLISVDDGFALVTGQGGHKLVNLNTFKVATPTPPFSGNDDLVFSNVDPHTIWRRTGTVYQKLTDSSSDYSWSSYSVAWQHDLAGDCLPSGYQPNWTAFRVSLDDQSLRGAFDTQSDGGGQDYAYYAVAYQLANNTCYLWNTKTGHVFAGTTDLGQVVMDNQPGQPPDLFLIHEAGGGLQSQYVLVSTYQNGCLSQSCLVFAPYIWKLDPMNPTTVARCSDATCEGHSAKLYLAIATGKNYAIHPYATPHCDPNCVELANFPTGFPDLHGTASNSDYYDDAPPFLVSADLQDTFPPVWNPNGVWGYNEVIAASTDPVGTVYRWAQTGASGDKEKVNGNYVIPFNCQSAIGIVSPQGDVLIFASDMAGDGVPGRLGYWGDQNQYRRCDVFMIRMQ